MINLQEAIENSGLTLNEISYLTGISNTYLAMIRKGTAKRISREKLVPLSIALRFSLDQTNELLKNYEEEPLRELDARCCIDSAEKRQLSGVQGLYTELDTQCALISLERVPGKTFFVGSRLLEIFSPGPSYNSKDVCSEIKKHLLQYRKKLLIDSLSHKYTEVTWLVNFARLKRHAQSIACNLVEVFDVSKEFPNFKLLSVEDHGLWEFELKYIVPGTKIKDKVIIFPATTSSDINPAANIQNNPLLIGLATDNTQMFSQYKYEVIRIIKKAEPLSEESIG